jgi:hypothetical protein
MPFANEHASEDDVKKFGLRKIWNGFHIPFQQIGLDENFHFPWIVDHERSTFLMRVHVGREELSNRFTFVLAIEGTLLTAILDRATGSTANIREETGKSVWDLVRLDIPSGIDVDRDKALTLLKEALMTYGYRGVDRVLRHYAVEFSF